MELFIKMGTLEKDQIGGGERRFQYWTCGFHKAKKPPNGAGYLEKLDIWVQGLEIKFDLISLKFIESKEILIQVRVDNYR